MSRSRKEPKPVQHIELSENNKKLRMILICVLLAVAAVAIGIGVNSALNVEPGWVAVEADASEVNCGVDFIFQYDLTDAGGSATMVNKQLTALYTEAARKAYLLFYPDAASELVQGIAYVNAHPNEAVTVDPALYKAFTLVEQYGSRALFLAPVYAEYDGIFFSEADVFAAELDPARNADAAAYAARVTAFTGDPEMIRLELLGNNTVRLHVSEEYLAFARENEIGTLIDFHWMKNAFILDYFADLLTEQGYTSGYLVSYDGFTRNLDTRGVSYGFNILDRQGSTIFPAAAMRYPGPAAIVYLRNYPLTEQDRWHYYSYESGETVTSYIDGADGLSKSAVNNLVSYSHTQGCAEVLLQLEGLYIAEELDTAALNALAGEGVYSIWCDASVIWYNDSALVLDNLYQDETVQYTMALAN